MSVTTPIGLLGLLAVPIILALHRRRRRPRIQRTVATAFLFGPDALPITEGRERARLVRSPSLWLELAAAIAMTVWLCGFRFGNDGPARFVLVLDDSASMAALAEEPLAKSVQRTCTEAFDDPAQSSLLTVIHSGSRPRVTVGPDAPYALLTPTLESWTPQAKDHGLRPAIQLAEEIAGTDARILVVTDDTRRTTASLLPAQCRLRALGTPRDNLALQTVDRRPLGLAGRTEVVRIEVRSFARTTTDIIAEVAEADRVLATKTRTLAPDDVAALSFELPASSRPWTVRIHAPLVDALALDSTATILPKVDRPLLYAISAPPESTTRLGLDRLSSVFGEGHLERVAPPAADLLIATESVPARAGARQLLIQPTTESKTRVRGPFVTAPWHPLLDGTSFDGVMWSAGSEPPVGEPLLHSESVVLASERRRSDGGYTLHLNLDPNSVDSNLGSRPDWPILLANLIAAAKSERAGPGPDHITLGELLRFRPSPDSTTDAAWVDPEGLAQPVHGPTPSPARNQKPQSADDRIDVWTFQPTRVGLHSLVSGGQRLARYAVRFADPVESDLRHRRSGELVPPPPMDVLSETPDSESPEEQGSPSARADTPSRPLGRLALLVCLLAIVLDYWWLDRAKRHPRGVVAG